MRAVGNHRGARTISLALVAGLVAFEAVLAGGTEAYRSGQREDFSIEVRQAESTLRIAAS